MEGEVKWTVVTQKCSLLEQCDSTSFEMRYISSFFLRKKSEFPVINKQVSSALTSFCRFNADQLFYLLN